jgi:hypothetical protein
VDADERCNCVLKAIQSQKNKISKELKERAAQNVLLYKAKISL